MLPALHIEWFLFDLALIRNRCVGACIYLPTRWHSNKPTTRAKRIALPYTVIKEANPPELGGTATGVINFLNFTFSELLAPVFGARLVQMPAGDTDLALTHYQAGFKPLLYGLIVALILTFFLKETGLASRKT